MISTRPKQQQLALNFADDFAGEDEATRDADALIAEVLQATPDQEEDFDVEAALQPDQPAVTQPGDLIELGPRRQHRLLWASVDRGLNPKLYRPFTHVERVIPWIFLAFYGLLAMLQTPWPHVFALFQAG